MCSDTSVFYSLVKNNNTSVKLKNQAMSSSECESSESLNEDTKKLSVLIVQEGGGLGQNTSFCGTLERHHTEAPAEMDPKGVLSWSVDISEGSMVMDSDAVKSSTRVDEVSRSWHEGEARGEEERELRRTRSCGAEIKDDGSSEVRLLRERLLRTQTRPQPTAVRLFTRRQRLTLASLALVDFMSFCSMSIMAPFFPQEATHKGMSDTVSGFVFGFYALVMFLSAPIFGKTLPVIGAKYMFMSGMLVAGVCNILFGTLELMSEQTTFTVFCFVIRGLEALGASAYSTASYVFVVNTFPANIGSVLGILETFVGLGMSVGPAIGGLLYSVGGFGLPFYVLGVAMVLAVPVNCCLLDDDPEYTFATKSGSILQLFKIPTIIITGLVIIIISMIWAFLDPTLEPHLRQYGLSSHQIGLIFLLFSALYGIFSPIWGWLADRVHNHWCMMVWGLLLCTAGLLLLGPSPFIPGLTNELWLDLLALSILGISVALTLLPTFQGVLSSSIYEGGCPAALTTYSVVAGAWSCCYSLGEVLGPAAGGAVVSRYGFPLCTTIMAAMCFTMALVTLAFFSLRDSGKLAQGSRSASSSLSCSGRSTWDSVASAEPTQVSDVTPLNSYSGTPAYGTNKTGTIPQKHKSSVSSPVRDALAYIFMFRFVTDALSWLLAPAASTRAADPCTVSYQRYNIQPSERLGAPKA